MITHNFNTTDLLTSPVWIVSPFEEQLIYANSAARLLMQDLTFSQLRTGPYSVSSQKELPKYLRSAKPTRYYRNPHRSAQWRGNSIELSACFAKADRSRTGDYFRRYRSTGNAGFKSQSLGKLSAQNKVFMRAFFWLTLHQCCWLTPHEMAKSSMLTSPRSISMAITMKRCARNILGK